MSLLPKAKQHVSIFDLPIWFANGLKPEFPSGLKGLNASFRYHHRALIVCIRWSPIDLRLGVGVPDREDYYVSFPIIDNRFWWCTDAQSACTESFEFI